MTNTDTMINKTMTFDNINDRSTLGNLMTTSFRHGSANRIRSKKTKNTFVLEILMNRKDTMFNMFRIFIGRCCRTRFFVVKINSFKTLTSRKLNSTLNRQFQHIERFRDFA
jgi:hypothetical protein